MFSIADQVGALYRALAPFRRYKLNMTKIESRPSKRKAWEYFFFVDCDGHMTDRKVSQAIANLERFAISSKSWDRIQTAIDHGARDGPARGAT
jgi:chorismate mutase/prephenate dehydratase